MLDQERVERFKNMALADPNNELAHFSLGRAYIDGGAPREAVAPLMRVLQINANFSKAYALLAQAQVAVGDPEGAVNTLTKGYRVANERGDLMPRNEMATMLKELNAPVPELEKAQLTPELAAAGNIQCARCGKVAAKMRERPFGGDLGERIYANVCDACFQQWIRQGTKVINELRLNLTEPHAQDVYDQHMKEFLNLN